MKENKLDPIFRPDDGLAYVWELPDKIAQLDVEVCIRDAPEGLSYMYTLF